MSKEDDVATAEAALEAAKAEPEDVFALPVLDKTKPYGTVMGDAVARYWQNGHQFDYLGNLVKE